MVGGSVLEWQHRSGYGDSFAPAGAVRFLLLTHSLRCGLHSSAALRLNPSPPLRVGSFFSLWVVKDRTLSNG